MVVEKIIDFLFAVVGSLLSLLPSVSYSGSLPSKWSSYQTFWGYVQMVAYLLPLGTITSIFALVLTISLFRLAIAVIRAVWDLLPFV